MSSMSDHFILPDSLPFISKTDGIGGCLKAHPSHFEVTELPLFVPNGMPGYVFLRIRRSGLGTREVQSSLAIELGLTDFRMIGVAGLKDKHARTTQTFAVPSLRSLLILVRPVGDESKAMIDGVTHHVGCEELSSFIRTRCPHLEVFASHIMACI